MYRLLIVALGLALTGCGPAPTTPPDASAPPAYQPGRDEFGNPDLNGIWQALGTANWNLEAHAASMGPIAQMGALGGIPAGLSVVEGGEIPYQPWAREQQQNNKTNWLALDPAVKCFLPGIPRATYMPYPFQIVQGHDTTFIVYEFASAARMIYMNRPDFEHEFDTWMGHSRGHFEGDTLVIDVMSNHPDTWFDSAGNFHSEQLRVEERFTRVSDHVLHYEALITDPKVFTRAWKIQMPLYRRLESNAQLQEYKCVEFAEELMYGHLRKKN